jgi:hypothetical protein
MASAIGSFRTAPSRCRFASPRDRAQVGDRHRLLVEPRRDVDAARSPAEIDRAVGSADHDTAALLARVTGRAGERGEASRDGANAYQRLHAGRGFGPGHELRRIAEERRLPERDPLHRQIERVLVTAVGSDRRIPLRQRVPVARIVREAQPAVAVVGRDQRRLEPGAPESGLVEIAARLVARAAAGAQCEQR